MMALGLVGAGAALLASLGFLSSAFAFASIFVIPLLTLAAAFIGTMSTGSVSMGVLVAVVSFAAPVIDATSASLAARNFDDASGYGIATGLAIAISVLVAFAFTAHRARVPREAAHI